MLLGSDENENKLFGSNNDSLDDTVNSSFMVSFKANESANSVSEKLKESAENNLNNASGLDYEDDLGDFEYNPAISAFKPMAQQVVPAAASTPAPDFPKAEAPINEVPAPKTEANINPFSAGQDLDFAASTSATPSPFKKVEAPAPKTNEALMSKAEATNQEAKSIDDTPKQPAPEVKNIEDIPTAAPNLQTYGKVTSGVNAFGKRNKDKEEQPKEDKSTPAVVAAPVPKAAPVQPQAQTPAPKVAPAQPQAQAPAQPQAQAPAPKAAPAVAAAAVAANNAPVKSRPGVAQEVKQPASTPGFAPRGRTNQVQPTPRPIPPTAPSSGAAAQRGNIQPVTTVNNKNKQNKTKKKREPGKTPIIVLVVLLALLLGFLYFMDNKDKWFGSSEETTETTKSANAVATTSKETTVETESTTTTEETTEATTTEETTEATTEETTEATEPSETTEETEATTTTEETTEATTTTEETTEATTTTTAEATTTTTASNSGTHEEPQIRYGINSATCTDNGFSFNISLNNQGNTDVNLASSLDTVTIRLSADEDINSLTSDYYTFTKDPNNGNVFIGTPKNQTIPAGETVNTTIYADCGVKVYHFWVDRYFFAWK